MRIIAGTFRSRNSQEPERTKRFAQRAIGFAKLSSMFWDLLSRILAFSIFTRELALWESKRSAVAQSKPCSWKTTRQP